MSMALGHFAFYVIRTGSSAGHQSGSRVCQEYPEEGTAAENPALAILVNPAGGILGAPAF